MSDSLTPESSSPSPSPNTPPNLHQNTIDPNAKWLVQKFGGTSVGKFPVQIASNIVSNYIDQYKVAVVCSARSGSTKALGTTNLLLQAAAEALTRAPRNKPAGTPGFMSPVPKSFDYFASPPESRQSPAAGSPQHPGFGLGSLTSISTSPSFIDTVDILRREHLAAASNAVKDPIILKELEAEIERDCDWLRAFLSAAQVIDEISPRSKDSIVGLGEKLGCKIITAALRDQGVDAEFVSLEDIILDDETEDGASSSPGALDQTFYDRLSIALGERIKQCSPRVPVVTGFFGQVPGSLLQQVGRGYTDLCSALLAVGLEADELQIWKEVDGIFTADPRKVPTARLIPMISPEEAAELTYYGSEVVHPFTMEQVIRKKIPIHIKNVENPEGGGTVIHPDSDIDAADVLDTISATLSLSGTRSLSVSSDDRPQRRLPTAVTIKEHIIILNVNSNRKSVSHGFLAGIFSTLDRFGVVVDLISTSEVHVSMAIEDGLGRKILDRLVNDLKKSGTVSVHREMAILSLVGKQMRNMVGIAGRMFTTLAQGNVNIEMISQGASEINISCVIDARDAVKALNLIHQSCLQIKPEGAKGRVGPWLF